jgi:phospholipase C
MGMEQINHLVILMMENRSFDHYLGALSLGAEAARHPDVDGLGDGHGELRTDLPVNLLNGKPVTPWQLDAPAWNDRPDPPWTRDKQGRWIVDHKNVDPPHEWPEVQMQFADGDLTGFVAAYQKAFKQKKGKAIPADVARLVMGYYTRETLPVLYALADEFAVCDHWFSSFLGSTWPNRVFVNAGHCGDLISTDDLLARYEKVFPKFIWEAWGQPRPNARQFTWKTYFFKEREEFTMFDLWPYTHVGHSEHGFDIAQFTRDCQQGTLPDVSIVEPNYDLFADHPWEDPRLGQHFISGVVNALLHSPSWQDTALILTYDEHGGFFDHVAPPEAPEHNPDKKFKHLGFRVPTIVMSPFTPKGITVHDPFDHTAILKTVADRWGFLAPGPRAPRLQSIWSSGPALCFDFDQPARDGSTIVIPDANLGLTDEDIIRAAARTPNDLSLALWQMHRTSQLEELKRPV